MSFMSEGRLLPVAAFAITYLCMKPDQNVAQHKKGVQIITALALASIAAIVFSPSPAFTFAAFAITWAVAIGILATCEIYLYAK